MIDYNWITDSQIDVCVMLISECELLVWTEPQASYNAGVSRTARLYFDDLGDGMPADIIADECNMISDEAQWHALQELFAYVQCEAPIHTVINVPAASDAVAG